MKLFIFGSTGDLVRRKVLPALQSMGAEELEIYALGRKSFIDETYRDFACTKECSDKFRKKIKYLKIDFGKTDICGLCEQKLDKNSTNYFYVSLPPRILEETVAEIEKIKRKGFEVRFLVEKPFGDSLESAEELKGFLEKNCGKEEIFLADHYLFKKNVLRMEPKEFKKLRIVALESLGLEGRMGYYDNNGALRDMVQSHFLNITYKFLGPGKAEGMEVKKFLPGQYGNGKDKGYAAELGKESKTETFAHVILEGKEKEIEFVVGKGFDKRESFLEVDGERTELGSGKEDYARMFSEFFAGKKHNFPCIKEAIVSWRIINKIEEKREGLFFYKKGSKTEEFL